MIIDTHHHFWKYNPEEYDWIDDSMSRLKRDYLPEHLKSEIKISGVNGVISVQARQIVEETNWLLQLAEENKFIKGVVGWLPLMDKNIKDYIDKVIGNKKLKALRHVVQGEPDPEFILRADFNNGIKTLKEYNLTYDILIFENQLPNTIKFVDRHPNQIFVLDHIAKPLIKDDILSPWKENIIELAKRENVYCKLSGMVTEADFNSWTYDQLKPYFDAVMEAFGAHRLMFGSDWPVCVVAIEYYNWVKFILDSIHRLSEFEQADILYKNAIKAYNLTI